MKRYIIVISVLFLCSCETVQKEAPADTEQIRMEIEESGQRVIDALNGNNAEGLMGEFWTSDSAMFLINGQAIRGYEHIKKGLTSSVIARKNMDLTVLNEEIMVFSPDDAMQVVEFKNEVTDLKDSTTKNRGAWTALYERKDTSWKVIMVHESFYPVE